MRTVTKPEKNRDRDPFTQRLGRGLRRLIGEREGISLIEFAFMAPILVTLLIGSFEIARFVLLNQKLNRLASNSSDLVTRSETMSEAELDNIFAAGEFITSPFRIGDNGVVIISSVSNPGPNDTTPPVVNWQQRSNPAAPFPSDIGVEGGLASLPTGVTLRVGQDIIISEVIYDFEPIMFGDMTDKQLYHISLHRPRLGSLTELTTEPATP